MEQMIKYRDLCLDAECVFAETRDKKRIKFSKYERALLTNFIHSPGLLQTRDKLLDVIGSLGSDSIDRNIDYLVSRLRRKLGDSANDPRYIATQYGEGYIWIARQQTKDSPSSTSIYLSVGPIFGLERTIQITHSASSFIPRLMDALNLQLGSHGLIELRPDDEHERQAHSRANYTIELSFISSFKHTNCNIVIINRQSGQVCGSFRQPLKALPNDDDADSVFFADIASRIKSKILDAQIFRAKENPTSSTDPLPVGMYKASHLFEPGKERLDLVEKKLRQRLEQAPNDHRNSVLLATNISNQLYAGNFDRLEEKNREIELLISDKIQSLQHDALYLSAIAERLFDLGRRDTGEILAEQALDIGPSYAACYLVVGRIHVLNGNIYEGLGYYEHSLEMAEYDSVFYQLVQTVKSIAYKALGEKETVRELAAYLIDKEENPLHKMIKQAFLLAGDKEALPLTVRAALRVMPKKAATHYMKILYYIAARGFKQEQHRENILRGLVEHIVSIHGESVVPEWIRESTPTLLTSQKS